MEGWSYDMKRASCSADILYIEAAAAFDAFMDAWIASSALYPNPDIASTALVNGCDMGLAHARIAHSVKATLDIWVKAVEIRPQIQRRGSSWAVGLWCWQGRLNRDDRLHGDGLDRNGLRLRARTWAAKGNSPTGQAELVKLNDCAIVVITIILRSGLPAGSENKNEGGGFEKGFHAVCSLSRPGHLQNEL